MVLTFFALILFTFWPFSGLAEEVFKLEQIVVSATKMEEKRGLVPNAVLIKKSEDIELTGPKSVGELLANEAGIGWLTYGDYGGAAEEIRIRGMPARGTQVLINGLNVNSPSLGVADVSRLPLENIERIEVVKGSGSLLYGSGAMGGTVNIFTKDPPREKAELNLKVGYGTQRTLRAYLQHGRFLNDNLGYIITAGRKETDGFRDNSDLKGNDLSLKLVFDKGEFFRASLYSDYVETRAGTPGVKPPKGTGEFWRNGVIFYNEEAASLINREENRDTNAILDIKGVPKETLRYNFKGFQRNMYSYYYERYASTGTGNETWVINGVSGVEGNISIRLFERTNLLFGGEYKEYGWRRIQYTLDQFGLRTTKERTSANIYTRALLTEAEYAPIHFLKFLGGIRAEHHSEFGEEFLPLFGAVFNPKKTVSVKITHGRHFSAPTPNDLYWPQTAWAKGNPDLKPEVGWHSDITYEQSFLGDRVFFSGSLFRWRVERKIAWTLGPGWVWSPFNLDDYGAKGFETNMRFGPFRGFSLSLHYTYVDAYEKERLQAGGLDKRRADYTPRNTFKGELAYGGTDLEASLIGRFVDRRSWYNSWTGSYFDIPSYWTFDLRLTKRFQKKWALTLDAKNLLDKDYVTRLGSFCDASGVCSISGYPGSGRSFFFRLSYDI